MPFTQEGLDRKKEELYSLPEVDFRNELKNIQNSTSKWIRDNFSLNDEQIEYLDSMPKEMLSEIGLSTAIAIDYRLILILETPPDEPNARIRICRNTDVSGSASGHWTPGEPPVIDRWRVTITFTF